MVAHKYLKIVLHVCAISARYVLVDRNLFGGGGGEGEGVDRRASGRPKLSRYVHSQHIIILRVTTTDSVVNFCFTLARKRKLLT